MKPQTEAIAKAIPQHLTHHATSRFVDSEWQPVPDTEVAATALQKMCGGVVLENVITDCDGTRRGHYTNIVDGELVDVTGVALYHDDALAIKGAAPKPSREVLVKAEALMTRVFMSLHQ